MDRFMEFVDIQAEHFFSDAAEFAGLPLYDPGARPSPPLTASSFGSPNPPYWDTTDEDGDFPINLTSGFVAKGTGLPIAPGDETVEWYGTALDGIRADLEPLPVPLETVISWAFELTYTLVFDNADNWDTYPVPPSRPHSVISSVRIFEEGQTGTGTVFGATLVTIAYPESDGQNTVRFPFVPSAEHLELLVGDARRVAIAAPSPIVPIVTLASGNYVGSTGIQFVQSPGERVQLVVHNARLVVEVQDPLISGELDLTRRNFT